MNSTKQRQWNWAYSENITGEVSSNDEMTPINIYNAEMKDSLTIVNAFNNYFLTAAVACTSCVDTILI
jgi:hypothetical protein